MAYATENRSLDQREEIILILLATLIPLLALATMSF